MSSWAPFRSEVIFLHIIVSKQISALCTIEKLDKAMRTIRSVAAIYETHAPAEQALRQLKEAGIGIRMPSIAVQHVPTEMHVKGHHGVGERMRRWGKIGALCGAVWGLIFDCVLFTIPGIEPVFLFGPLVSWFLAVFEGAILFGGISVLVAALVSIRIQKARQDPP